MPIVFAAIFLALFVHEVNAKITLTQKERAVLDSVIAAYSELTPVAALPKDWPPDVDNALNSVSVSFMYKMKLPSLANSFARMVDPTAMNMAFFHSKFEAGPDLPVRGTQHELGSEVGITLLDSNDVLIRWRQNFREPLAVERIERALAMTEGARCVILDLQEFDVYYVDSLLKALSYFAPDSLLQLTEVARVPHEARDEYEEHRTTANAKAWRGPLVVMLRDTGWPGIGIKAICNDREYSRFYISDRNREILGYQYATVFLPEEYVVHVPTVVLMRKGKILKTKLQLQIEPTFYYPSQDEKLHDCRNMARRMIEEYTQNEASFLQRLSWWWKEWRREKSEQKQPQEMIIE